MDILLVIVLYNERLENSQSFKSLYDLKSSIPLFVWDNSIVAQHNQTEFPQNIKYVHCPENYGVSFAYNRAAEYARLINISWLLLLDQDTIFPIGALELYEKSIDLDKRINIIIPQVKISEGRYISPVKRNILFLKPQRLVPNGYVDISEYYFINSGIAIKRKLFELVNGYNEQVKLDFSDIEFIHRLRKIKNESVVMFVLDCICLQSFSNQEQSLSQKLKRFELFCQSLKYCSRENMSDRIVLFFIVFKRAISLSLVSLTFEPLFVLFKKYLF